MNSRLVEQLARQRHAELQAKAERHIPPRPRKRQGPGLRAATGWAVVAIGLRIAESGRRRPTSIAPANSCR